MDIFIAGFLAGGFILRSYAAVWAPGQIVSAVQAVYDVLCQLVESLGECRVVEHQPVVIPAGAVHLPFPYAFPD